MTRKTRIFTVVLALASLAPFAVRADEAAAAAGSTLIDVGGTVTTAGIAGGMADPVPLFVGPSGPAVFVMGVEVPGATAPSMESQLNETVLQGFKPPGPKSPFAPHP
ncbi:MAG: hypothetical protein Q7S99_08395 [Parvibaculum sp.]|nr:hypothetical protein [Parvibaculum sp.]|tara:strand:+ start:350 stop:670 length:321 start_codon:yes stop_codon:yes gene_type:complete